MSDMISDVKVCTRTTPSIRHERAFALGVAAQIDQPGTDRGQAPPCTDAAHNGGDACTSSARAHAMAAGAQGLQLRRKKRELWQWASWPPDGSVSAFMGVQIGWHEAGAIREQPG